MSALLGLLAYGQVKEISRRDTSYFETSPMSELKSGISDGIYRVYFDSVKTSLELSGTIVGGLRTGTWTWYYENGLIKREVEYQQGLFNGVIKSWFPNGQLSATITYTMGTANGEATRWHDNGIKKSEGMMLKGTPKGLWRYWKSDGSLLLEKTY